LLWTRGCYASIESLFVEVEDQNFTLRGDSNDVNQLEMIISQFQVNARHDPNTEFCLEFVYLDEEEDEESGVAFANIIDRASHRERVLSSESSSGGSGDGSGGGNDDDDSDDELNYEDWNSSSTIPVEKLHQKLGN
jgi:hypothetical protein